MRGGSNTVLSRGHLEQERCVDNPKKSSRGPLSPYRTTQQTKPRSPGRVETRNQLRPNSHAPDRRQPGKREEKKVFQERPTRSLSYLHPREENSKMRTHHSGTRPPWASTQTRTPMLLGTLARCKLLFNLDHDLVSRLLLVPAIHTSCIEDFGKI